MSTVSLLHSKPEKGSYPRTDFLDGDVLNIRLVDEAPDNGVCLSMDAVEFGRPVRPNLVPTKAIWKERYRPSDLLSIHSCICVSDALRSKIEEIEPSVHQFFPLDMMSKGGEFLAGHWIWIVCNRINSVDRDASNMNLRHGIRWVSRDVKDPKLVFNLSQIGARQFWRDLHLGGRNLLVSQKASEILKAADFTGLELREREAI